MFQSPNTSTLQASSPNGEGPGPQSINFPQTDEDLPPDVHRVDVDVDAPGEPPNAAYIKARTWTKTPSLRRRPPSNLVP